MSEPTSSKSRERPGNRRRKEKRKGELPIASFLSPPSVVTNREREKSFLLYLLVKPVLPLRYSKRGKKDRKQIAPIVVADLARSLSLSLSLSLSPCLSA